MQTKFAVLIWLFIISGSLNLKAQQAKFHPLKIGDTMPDIILSPVVNYSKSHVRISDFKGKALILDFWSLWCSGCIAAFPRLEALKNEYKDQLVIMPVSFMHTAGEVRAFYKRREAQNKKISLPSAIYKDTVNDMLQLFPLTGFPLEVWIDKAGVVRHITDAFYVTPQNIEKFIHQQQFNLPSPPHLQDSFDAYKPLLVRNNGGPDSAFIYRSLITPYLDSVNSNYGFLKQQTKKGIRLFYPNASVVDLMKASVFGKMEDPFNKKVVVQSADSSNLFYPAFDTSYYTNLKFRAYCYELILPPQHTMQEALQMMHQNICMFFKLHLHLKKERRGVGYYPAFHRSTVVNFYH